MKIIQQQVQVIVVKANILVKEGNIIKIILITKIVQDHRHQET